jgi:hypothetical protein
MRCSTARASNRACTAAQLALAATWSIFPTSCGGPRRPATSAFVTSTFAPPAADEAAACPRDAVRAASGRCTCEKGTLLAMGACVDSRVADAFCAPAGRMTDDGCAFVTCDAGQEVDLATGQCISRSSVLGSNCSDGSLAAVAASRSFCVPNEASCPRGTTRGAGNTADPLCARGARCPPGSVSDAGSCRPVVFSRDRLASSSATGPDTGDRMTVDLGAWTARALGPGGGKGSPELCRPLQMRPDLFPAERGGAPAPLDIEVAVSVPNQDVTQAYASVAVRATQPLSTQAESAVRDAVDSLIDLFRSLGGDATAASASVRVQCTVGPSPSSTRR